MDAVWVPAWIWVRLGLVWSIFRDWLHATERETGGRAIPLRPRAELNPTIFSGVDVRAARCRSLGSLGHSGQAESCAPNFSGRPLHFRRGGADPR